MKTMAPGCGRTLELAAQPARDTCFMGEGATTHTLVLAKTVLLLACESCTRVELQRSHEDKRVVGIIHEIRKVGGRIVAGNTRL
jgi:hypothetical protein